MNSIASAFLLTIWISLLSIPTAAESSSDKSDLVMLVYTGKTDAVLRLLNQGADPNRLSGDLTPLIAAVKTQRENLVALLLENGAKVDVKNKQGATALMYAVQTNQLALVKRLLASGANHSLKNDEGWTPLMMSVSGGFIEIVELLLRYGALDAKCEEVIALAKRSGNEKILALLMNQ